MFVENWPKYSDGTPVMVGDTVVGLCGPMKVYEIGIRDGGWELWAQLSNRQGELRKLYVIEQGASDDPDSYALRPGEYCEYSKRWVDGVPDKPEYVFMPVKDWEERDA